MRMDRDKDFFAIINQLQKKQRRIVIVVGVLAFIVGAILGSMWAYKSIDQVTIISAEPQLSA